MLPIPRLLGPLVLTTAIALSTAHGSWTVVDTGQDAFFNDRSPIARPAPGAAFHGQDAHYAGPTPAYRDNGDGTVTDLVTGLEWSRAVDPKKVSLEEAETIARELRLGGHDDWRVPTIKELYSLIDFRGVTGLANPSDTTAPRSAVPYLNTDYFDFRYGGATERYIDAQWLSSTRSVSPLMDGMDALFGVNFADGRIKGYPVATPDPRRPEKKFYARYVRGGAGYGVNDFVDNRDGTVTDRASGLVWQKADSGRGMTWQDALTYAENLTLAGHDDWRLPNAKELQSIVDYTRSPDATDSPAIAPVFQTTAITNEAGRRDWPFFWTSTTHLDGPDQRQAVYVAFGRAIGQMHGRTMDVHGAGAQRSDPKTGSPRIGHGPQGDAQRVLNFVRCVRGGVVATTNAASSTTVDHDRYPQTVRVADETYRPEKATRRPDSSRSPEMPRSQPTAGGNGPGAEAFIRRLDRDRDGKVSRSEFDGPAEHFDDFDRNRDGYISAEEAPTGPPPQRR